MHLARVLTYCSLLSAAPFDSLETAPTLVRVNIITEIRGAKDTVELNGKLLADYSPTIIQEFPSTGIVLDHKGHILTFLGYRWVDIQSRDARIEISTGEGKKLRGKLVGIDQRNGVAVIRPLRGVLKKTPLCTQCEVKDGAVVMAPIVRDPGMFQYREAQIISVGAGQGIPEPGNWIITMNRPFPDIGQPILTADHRVLGFVAGQDPMGMQTIVCPIDQMLSSAEKILKTGGDIRAGWLGVLFAADLRAETGAGVAIQSVVPDSPAQKAGLMARDFLRRYNGQEIQDARQLIHLVEGTPIGSKANLEILRQGNPMIIAAVVEARRFPPNPSRLSFNLPGTFDPLMGEMAPESAASRPRLLMGLHTIMLTPSLADFLHMPGQTGLLVTEVEKKLPADRAGVLVGDVVTAVDEQPVIDALDFASFLQTHNWGPRPILKVLRKGIEHTIVVQISEQGP